MVRKIGIRRLYKTRQPIRLTGKDIVRPGLERIMCSMIVYLKPVALVEHPT